MEPTYLGGVTIIELDDDPVGKAADGGEDADARGRNQLAIIR